MFVPSISHYNLVWKARNKSDFAGWNSVFEIMVNKSDFSLENVLK